MNITSRLASRSLSSESVELSREEQRSLAFLLPLSEDYPGISTWFARKVVPGLRSGTRLLLPVERDDQLVGLGIGKDEGGERKICTVRVSPTYVGRGIGVRLFDGLLKWLNDDRPHLTVSTAKLPQFERIFDHYGFDLTSTYPDLYVPRAVELGYNEPVGEIISGPIAGRPDGSLHREYLPG